MSYSMVKSNNGGFNVLFGEEVIGWCAVPWQFRRLVQKHIDANPIPYYIEDYLQAKHKTL